jgi:preprotein translocase subunit YajC
MNVIFLQASGGGLGTLLFPLLMLVVMYFFFFRPQMTRQKAQNAFQDSLEKGKDVVTASGIIGKINKIEGNVVTLQIATNTYIRVTKSSINKEMTETMASSISNDANG